MTGVPDLPLFAPVDCAVLFVLEYAGKTISSSESLNVKSTWNWRKEKFVIDRTAIEVRSKLPE